MSSFINTAKHFNSIENMIVVLTNRTNVHPFPSSFRDKWPELYNSRQYNMDRIEKSAKSIMDTLRELQVLCVELQYKHHREPGTLDIAIAAEIAELKTIKDFEPLTLVSFLKALQCMYYQIEPEHLKELRPLTQAEQDALFFCEEMIPHLALNIIHDLPDYNKAKWAME